MSAPTTAATGPGLSTLLTVLFVGLKLANVIAWPWWQVLAPLWISLVCTVIVAAVTVASQK